MRLRHLIITVLVILFGLSINTRANAAVNPPSWPFIVYGEIDPGNNQVLTNSVVIAKIKEAKVAETQVQNYNQKLVYKLTIPADDPDTPALDGGKEGNLIKFWVDNLEALQTTTWKNSTTEKLNLSFYVPTPSPTPTPTPPPTETPSPVPTLPPTPSPLVTPTPVPTICEEPNQCRFFWWCPKAQRLDCSRFKRCCQGETPTPSPPTTPSSRPTPSLPPTPSPGNNPPEITTNSLPRGRIFKRYAAKVEVKDEDADQIKIKATGLPYGLRLQSCQVQAMFGGRRITTCWIRGRPYQVGNFQVKIKAQDNQDLSEKKLSLFIGWR